MSLLFDEPYYIAINEARWAALGRMLDVVAVGSPLDTVVDAGCGPGWFSQKLLERGLKVRGLEGREDLVDIARRRAPGADFEVFDFDAVALGGVGPVSDAVVAFGLLYHLENPLRTLRICRQLARHSLFLETMTIPESGPYGRLVNENPNETQGLRPLALVLTASAIVAALHNIGFPHVYRFAGPISHPDFADTAAQRKRRDVFLATDEPVQHPDLHLQPVEKLGRYDFTHNGPRR